MIEALQARPGMRHENGAPPSAAFEASVVVVIADWVPIFAFFYIRIYKIPVFYKEEVDVCEYTRELWSNILIIVIIADWVPIFALSAILKLLHHHGNLLTISVIYTRERGGNILGICQCATRLLLALCSSSQTKEFSGSIGCTRNQYETSWLCK